ncbi:MAG TPA: alpha amylase family protein [Chthonomonadaceae bacterium]|nr:alpha amylase family protein [Chthonomonadaceae bacterium]
MRFLFAFKRRRKAPASSLSGREWAGGLLPVLSLLLCAVSGLPAQAQRPPDLARSMSAMLGAQGRLLWIDGTANLTRARKDKNGTTLVDYTTTRAGVAEIVRRCKAAHINTLVVDVKPLSGQVLYKSKVAPRMREWKGHPLPDFDVLAAFVEEGHKAGLQVDACINVLSEGHKYYSVGPAYEHPDWQSVVYTVNRGMVAADGARLSVRVPGEPDDPTKPALLMDEDVVLGGEPTSGMVGLESTESANGLVNSSGNTKLGQQLNLVLDANNRAIGVVDSALLGDDPLIAPEDGHILTATRDADRAWITQHVRPGGYIRFDLRTERLPVTQAPSEKVSCFVNPLHPDARRHELDMVRELASNYAIDGLVLDRCRYANINNDFSDRTRAAFERWLGHPVARWPEDVFAFSPTPGGKPIRGPLFNLWLEFRAQVIRDFVSDVAQTARSARPGIKLGTYVGSWYPNYYEVGVNWGSDKTHLRYPWFTPNYPLTGYAEFFDWIATGCYYPTATREEARREGASEKGTVEYAAELSNMAVASGAFVYAGVYVPDYADDPERFLRALKSGGRQAQGWMIFDLSYLDEYNWWPLLERAYGQEAPAPDDLPELLPALRSAIDCCTP